MSRVSRSCGGLARMLAAAQQTPRPLDVIVCMDESRIGRDALRVRRAPPAGWGRSGEKSGGTGPAPPDALDRQDEEEGPHPGL